MPKIVNVNQYLLKNNKKLEISRNQQPDHSFDFDLILLTKYLCAAQRDAYFHRPAL